MGIIDPTYHSYPEGIEFCHNPTSASRTFVVCDGVILQHPVKEPMLSDENVEFVADAVVKIDNYLQILRLHYVRDGILTQRRACASPKVLLP